MNRIVFAGFLLFMMLASQVSGQVRTITGRVTDAADGSTLPGVSIVVQGTTQGTVTDINGRYEISAAGDATLVFSFIGMISQEVPVQGRNVINVALESELVGLEEVVVVAYGTATRGSFTGALTTIGAEKIEARPIANVSTAIEGTAPGIQVSSASGQPGSGQAIRIRGFGSVNASNAPLYVVDGVPYTMDISNLNPADIESISVLKDAAATALYGNRAANGVIMITTKSGTRERGRFNIRATQGFTNRAIPEYERVNAYEYYPLFWEGYRNSMHYSQGVPMDEANMRASGLVDGVSGIADLLNYNPFNVPGNQIVGTDGQLNPNARLIYNESDLDWADPISRIGDRREYNLNYSGGTGTSDYYVSLGYLDEKGFVIKSDFQRITGRLNVNSQLRDWLRSGLNVSANVSSSESARTASSTGYVNPFFFARNIGPIFPVYAIDPATGEYILDDAGRRQYDLGGGEFGLPNRPSGASPGRHIVAETMWNEDMFQRNVISARTFAEAKFLDHFTFTANVGIDVNAYYAGGYDNNRVGDGAPAGRARKTSTTTRVLNFNQLLNYNRSFNQHSFDVLLGHESYQWDYDYFYGFKQGLIVDGNIELVNFTTINSTTSYVHKYRSEGFFSRLNYDFDNRYFLSGSFRRDGSSKFYVDSRWGNFWSLSGAWRLDQENFMRDMTWVNMAKLRSSYGQVGNDAGISYYVWQALYSLGWNNAAEPGFVQSTLASRELVWEANNSFGVGLDFGLFNRVTGNIDFFHRVSDNLLFDVPLPISSGVASTDMNIGTMFNQGIELRVATDIIQQENFNWNFDFNITTFRNEFSFLPQEEIITGTKKLMVGRGLYDYWLRQWYGVDPEDGMALFWAEDTQAGDVRIINGDTVTTNHNNARYDYSGSAIPDFLGGITNSFRIGNFDINLLVTYQIGGYIYDGTYGSLMTGRDYGDALHVDIKNRWQQPGDVTNVPRFDVSQTSVFSAASTRWLTDASFLSVRSLYIGYRIPRTLLERANIQNASIYVNGENLWLSSKRVGMDPQIGFTGVTSNVYSPARIFTVGVNVSL
jgi:TonB-linked SusC/RagA family outer membrane protein